VKLQYFPNYFKLFYYADRHTCRRTYILPGILLFFAVWFPRLLNGTQRKSATFPYKSRVEENLFWTTSQLNGNFNGLYLRNETRCQVRWQLQRVCYIVSKRHKLWSTNDFKLDGHFYPPYVNTGVYFIVRLCRRTSSTFCKFFVARRCTRSVKGTEPNCIKRKEVNGADESRIRWRRITNVNETIEMRKWQYIVNCHFLFYM